jgi:hypothetical protein
MQTRFVYVIEKPGSDLDQEDTIIRAETREEADELASARCKAWDCQRLRFIGVREGAKFIAKVPAAELPEWARQGAA